MSGWWNLLATLGFVVEQIGYPEEIVALDVEVHWGRECVSGVVWGRWSATRAEVIR